VGLQCCGGVEDHEALACPEIPGMKRSVGGEFSLLSDPLVSLDGVSGAVGSVLAEKDDEHEKGEDMLTLVLLISLSLPYSSSISKCLSPVNLSTPLNPILSWFIARPACKPRTLASGRTEWAEVSALGLRQLPALLLISWRSYREPNSRSWGMMVLADEQPILLWAWVIMDSVVGVLRVALQYEYGG
jgi:hypothetical protein